MWFRFGRHPAVIWSVQWSGVIVPLKLAESIHMDGIVELTELALNGASDGPN